MNVGYGLPKEKRAQATVEMAIVTPVLLVLALIVYNLMQFVVATARFDRVAPDVVLAHGVAPMGTADAGLADGAAMMVQEQLIRAMDGCDVDVEVTAVTGDEASSGGLLSMVGALRTFRCVMTYTPWPGGWSIAGVPLGAPATMTHVREVTVDPWRSGVVA